MNTIKLINYHINALVKDKSMLIMIVLFPLLAAIMCIVLIPFAQLPGTVLSICTLPISMIIYLRLVVDYKTSGLQSNHLLTKRNKFSSYISTFIMMYISIIFITILLFLFLIIFNELNLLVIYGMRHNNTTDLYLDFSQLDYSVILYIITIYTISLFSFLFLFTSITNNRKFYVMLMVAFLITSIFYSATVNDY